MTDALAVADQFFRAIEAGDIDMVAALYAYDAAIWHNFDRIAQSKPDNLKVLAWMIKSIPQRRYEVVRRTLIPGGFFQQHVLALSRNGATYDMPACIICQVEGGKIVRLDEYLDSAHVAEMRARLSI